jgi:hypothetical protein
MDPDKVAITPSLGLERSPVEQGNERNRDRQLPREGVEVGDHDRGQERTGEPGQSGLGIWGSFRTSARCRSGQTNVWDRRCMPTPVSIANVGAK